MVNTLDFEKNAQTLESKLQELRHIAQTDDLNIADEVTRLEKKLEKTLQTIYKKLTPWQTVQIARHLERPCFLEYVDALFKDFTPLSGDRTFAEDEAILGGLARFQGRSVVILGHQKGRTTEERVKHNFGMARPEGYRKARRLMELADQFSLPLITFVDTPGAHPGVQAEARGQSEAIAKAIETMAGLKVPVISTIIGEGGSGGAVAMAVANRVFMLQYSVYSVISPEGCASILWRTNEKKTDAAQALKLTAPDLLKLKVIDGIVSEPVGAAHRHRETVFGAVEKTIAQALEDLSSLKPKELQEQRQERFLNLGRLV